jgi:uncharacterized protein (TIGR02099 family)
MRKRSRRLWTLVLTLSATVLIMVVVAAAGFRLLVKAAPGYRDDVEQRASAVFDRRVTIRELDLSWRRFRPSLDLLDVTLYGDDGRTPALKLRELNVGISVLALLTARLRAADLRVTGVALSVERLADGSLRVSGISTEKPLTLEELRSIARAAERVGRFVVADSQLLWLDYTDPSTFHRIDDINLTLSTSGSRHRLRVSARLPAAFGGELRLDASGRGDLEAFEQLAVEAKLEAQNLRAGVWTRPWLRKGLSLEGSGLQVQLNTRWQGTRLQAAAGRMRSGVLQVRQAGRVRALVDDLQSEFSLGTVEGGWRLTLERLSIKAPARQPTQASGSFEYRPATDSNPLSLSGGFDQLRLDELGEWLALVDLKNRAWLAGLRPVGRVQDLRFQYQAAAPPAVPGGAPEGPRYSLHGRFEGVGFSPEDRRPGVTGASGRLKLDQTGGELQLMMKNGQLLAPEVFGKPMPLTLLSGTLAWKRSGPDWLLSSQGLRWQGPGDMAGRSDLELKLFGAGGAPYINLDLTFAGQDMDAVRPFIPRVPTVLKESVRVWLYEAIRSGKVSHGRLQIRGLLNHFPYHNPHEAGLFRIDFDVRDGVLQYAHDWPAIERINAHLVFQGRTMLIDSSSASILGMPVGPVKAEIKDFYEALLEVTGAAAGDAGKMLSFLTESPLRSQYTPLVQALALKGPARLDLRLEIPLDQLHATRVSGVVTLDGKTQLSHAKLPEPVTGITGQVRFDNSGLTARDLRGVLLGLPLALQLDPEQTAEQHLTRLQASTEAVFPRDAGRLARLVPASMLARLQGSSRWHADMLFDVSAKPARLSLGSDLSGLAIDLPPPFAKAADTAVPASISIDPSAATGLRADVRYGNLLRAALQLRDSQGSWTLERGHIVLGEGNAQLPERAGLWLDGRLPELDLAQWQSMLAPAGPAATEPAAPAAAPLLQQADLRFGRMLAGGQVFENLRLQLARDAGDWLLQASGSSMNGTLRWPQKSSGRRPIYRADLERLVLSPAKTATPETGVKEQDVSETPPRDPAKLPGLSLRCRSLRVGERVIGQLHLEAVPVPNGLSLTTLSLTGDLEVQGSGSWTRVDGESSAQLSLSARGNQLRNLFDALGYAPSLEADKIRLQASLAWAARAEGIKTDALGGGFSLDLEKGVLMSVEPGAGRVLGLLNFYALPRRLTLDFRDVVSKGLAFDTLKGDFRLEQGNAWTDNLKIRGPSLQMEITGRVGIAARDYDQKVTIHPQVSAGVALAGTALGGPAVGLGLLLAQRLFKKPLEEMSELSYRLRGPWDNPTIEKDG